MPDAPIDNRLDLSDVSDVIFDGEKTVPVKAPSLEELAAAKRAESEAAEIEVEEEVGSEPDQSEGGEIENPDGESEEPDNGQSVPGGEEPEEPDA